jgi:hypothetical protein
MRILLFISLAIFGTTIIAHANTECDLFMTPDSQVGNSHVQMLVKEWRSKISTALSTKASSEIAARMPSLKTLNVLIVFTIDKNRAIRDICVLRNGKNIGRSPEGLICSNACASLSGDLAVPAIPTECSASELRQSIAVNYGTKRVCGPAPYEGKSLTVTFEIAKPTAVRSHCAGYNYASDVVPWLAKIEQKIRSQGFVAEDFAGRYVRLRIEVVDNVGTVTVDKSSGSPTIDGKALSLVAKASPFERLGLGFPKHRPLFIELEYPRAEARFAQPSTQSEPWWIEIPYNRASGLRARP